MSRLTSRMLLSTAALLLGAASLVPSATAQVVYTDVEPDVQISGWEMHPVNFGPEPNTSLIIWKHPNEVVINTLSAKVEVLYEGSYPASLEDGATISASGTWRSPSYDALNHAGTTGHWIGVEDRYLGVRYKVEGVWHYTWVRMDVEAGPNSFTLKDYAEEETPEGAIVAGSTTSADVTTEEISDAWTINGREITATTDCEVRVAGINGSVVITEELDAGESYTIDAPAGAYLISIQSARMSEVVKVVLR